MSGGLELDTGHDGTLSTTEDFELDITERCKSPGMVTLCILQQELTCECYILSTCLKHRIRRVTKTVSVSDFVTGHLVRYQRVCIVSYDIHSESRMERIPLCAMAGPSFTMDAQGAASLAALTTAAMSLRFQTELYKPNHAALVGGVYLMLAGTTWLLYSAKGQLSPVGRCFSFDQSADGFVKSEGVANLVLTLLNEAEDAEVTMNGIIAATHTNHTGRTASLTAPCGPQQGELIQQALRQAAISPTTVDAVECFSHGRYMQDAVEAEVAKRTLRGYDANEMPLSLSSGFTSSGMSMEAAGMMQILRVLVTQKYGTILPSLHLQQLNPYIEEPNDQESALFATEHLQLEGLSSYHGITGQSLGGTMCHVITLGNRQVENEQPPSNETPQEHVTTREAQQLAASKFWLPKTIG